MTGPTLCPSPASNTKQLTRMYVVGGWLVGGLVLLVEQFLCAHIADAAFEIANWKLLPSPSNADSVSEGGDPWTDCDHKEPEWTLLQMQSDWHDHTDFL